MLEITVKTLDGRNRTFNVDDDITVKQFKETIASSIEIGADVQRLIFRGKVLVDDKKINDYDVNGQTLHVVQRAPPQTASSASSEAGQSSSTNSRRNGFELQDGLPQGIHIEMIPEGGMVNGSGATAQSESRKRINQATRMLDMAKDVLSGLEQQQASSSDNNNKSTTATTAAVENMETDEPSTSQESSSQQPQQQQQSEEEPSTDPPATALADLLEEVLRVNGRMEDHIRQYRDIMRTTTESAEDAQSLEAVCQGTSKAMHLMSHVYHNLSDLFCDFTAPGPRRLRAFSPPMRQATTIIQQTIPVQVSAQFNVSPVLRENATTTPSSAAPTSSSVPPQAATTTTTAAASSPSATTTTSSASSASGFNPSSFFSELNRLVGGEVPNLHFGSTSSGTSQMPQGLGRAFQMFMEMGPNGSISTSTSGTPTTDQAPSSAAPTSGTSTTPPTSATSTNSTEPNTPRSANVTVSSSSGSGPGFLSDDFLQNIIQVATGVALQNGAAQRPHLVMLGPQLFMGSGQRGQTSQRRRATRRANDGSTQANPSDGNAGASSAAGTPRSEQPPRRFREYVADPCLPCNSWHFGHRTPGAAAAPSAEASTTGQQSAPTGTSGENVRRNPMAESSTSNSLNRDLQNLRQAMGTLQELTSSLTRAASQIPPNQAQQQSGQPPASLESVIARVLETAQQGNTIESILNALGSENVQSEGLLSDLIACLAPHITFVDMFNLVLGQSAPLRKLRQPLQNFVRDSLLEQRPPTEENIATAVNTILVVLQQDIREVSACVQAKEDIDFTASLRAFLRYHLANNIRLIITATDDTAFGEQLHANLNECLHSLVNLCRYCLRDEDRAIEAIIQNRIRNIYDESNPMFRPFMTQWMTQFLQSKLPTIPRSDESVLPHVVRMSVGDEPEVKREADVESSGSFESASANTLDEKMEEDTPSPRMFNGQAPFQEAQVDGHHPRLSEEVVARLPPPPADDFELAMEKEGDDNGWKSVVPKDWVPVIAKDGARQRRQALDSTREPLSDAYLCGVPAKRRKIMMKEKTHGTVQSNAQLNNLSDSIRHAANQVNCQPITSFQDVRADLETSHNLLSAYREELARNAEAAEDDFDAPGN